MSRGTTFTKKIDKHAEEEVTTYQILFEAFAAFRDSEHPDWTFDDLEEWELLDALHFILCEENRPFDEQVVRRDDEE